MLLVLGTTAVSVVGLAIMLPLLMTAPPPRPPTSSAATGPHPVVVDAYASAARRSSELGPGCAVRWSVLAGIGQVESANAAGRQVDADGAVSPPVLGIALDGRRGTRRIADTDGGRWDGDRTWDRAVGALQFIPTSWRAHGVDGNGDGAADPHNLYDAALAAVAHLCRTSPGDFEDDGQLARALRRYNDSATYVAEVLRWIAHFDALVSPGASASSGSYGLPLDRSWFEAHPDWLTKPHHDYPAADLPVPPGTPIRAAAGGTVRVVTESRSRCGNGVVVDGDDGWRYVYCHASAVLVELGQQVATGRLLARSGSSGNSSGPHLHFGVERPGGARVCPQPLLQAWYRGEALAPDAAPRTGCT